MASPLPSETPDPQDGPPGADVGNVDDGGDNSGETGRTSAARPVLVPQANGGALLSGGLPGNKGGSGRPKKAWKAFCREAIDDPTVQDKALARARKGAVDMLKLLADHGEGAPEQRITLQADTAALDRLFARLAPQLDPRTLPDSTLETRSLPAPPLTPPDPA